MQGGKKYEHLDGLESSGKEETGPSTRLVAFAAVVFATAAVCGCLIAFPLTFQHVQYLKATVASELDFCRSKTNAMFMASTEAQPSASIMSRMARQVPAVNTGGCCCQQGPAGPAGSPGGDGRDGAPGDDGVRGEPGRDASSGEKIKLIPPQCPCRNFIGPQGPVGPKGPIGQRGSNGLPGKDGGPGLEGPAGPKGDPGRRGPKGSQGPRGDAGEQIAADPGPVGRAGFPGNTGLIGPPGQPGNDGKPGTLGPQGLPGQPGQTGRQGNRGPIGEAGPLGPFGIRGTCDHCPPARLSPGY